MTDLATERAGQAPSAAAPWPAQRLVMAACAVLLVLVAVQYLVTLVGVPRYYQRVTHGEVPTLVFGGDSDVSNALVAAAAAKRGLSLGAYAVYNLLVTFGVAAGFCAAAGLVLWKHGGDWFRWLTAVLLAFFPTGELFPISIVAFPEAFPYLSAGGLLWPLLLLFLFLFPNGRAPARWTRWPMAGFFVAHAVFQTVAFIGSLWPLPVNVPALVEAFGVMIAGAFVYLAACQGYRYVRVAGPVERKQIQWFVAAMGLLAAGSLFDLALGVGGASPGDNGYWDDFDSALGLVLPAAIVIAILRYRLWDIDVIIRRTLIYSVLTGLLALTYFGSVLVLEGVFRALTGQGQGALVTVLSTLALAALFVPVRARVQRAIDRRFYRRKYDAARALVSFGANARDETDLDQLSAQLTAVVEDTLQPAQVSLWLRGSKH